MRYLFTPLAAALALLSGTAAATDTSKTIQRQRYVCDAGGPVRATYYFGSPKAYVVLENRLGRRRLFSDSRLDANDVGGFSDGSYTWIGSNLFEDKLGESTASLAVRKRVRVNGRLRTVQSFVNKSCVPAGQ